MRLLALPVAFLFVVCGPTGRAIDTTPPSPSLTSDAWAALRHSSRIVPLTPGEPCIVSPQHDLVDAGTAPGQADPSAGGAYAPIYAVGTNPLGLGRADASGYQYGKVLWVAAPKTGGPILIRGQRIDAPGDVRFQPGGEELHFDDFTGVRAAGSDSGWRYLPSLVGVRAPGCYSFQIDGSGFITIITIKIDAS